MKEDKNWEDAWLGVQLSRSIIERCNSGEALADRTKENMAAKAFFFLLIAVTVTMLGSDAMYLKRTSYPSK